METSRWYNAELNSEGMKRFRGVGYLMKVRKGNLEGKCILWNEGHFIMVLDCNEAKKLMKLHGIAQEQDHLNKQYDYYVNY